MTCPRYLVFAGFFYYPCGGWEDLAGTADTYESALIMAQDALEKGYEWRHIVDLEAMTVKEEDGAYAGSAIQRRVHQSMRDIADADIEGAAADLMDDILDAARERAMKEAEEPGSVIQRDIHRALVDLKKAEIVRVAANLMDSIQPLHTMRIERELVKYLRAIQWGDRTTQVLVQSIKAITESPLDLGQSRAITLAVRAVNEADGGDLDRKSVV